MNDSPCALITGASSGIGLHLARTFARHGHPVVLVAPVQAELEDVARDIAREFDVRATAIACDLERDDAVQQIQRGLDDAGIEIGILVNNAGHGQLGRFWEVPLETHLSILKLNVEAVLRLTSHFLPKLVARGSGRVLNTASVAGFEAGPTLSVYHASKAFVLSWSEALAVELRDTGVTVTALCPGPTDTDFFPKADMLDTNAFQKAKVMSPQEVADAGYGALMAGDSIVVPGASNKALVFARRFMSEGAQAKMNEKLYAPADKHARDRGDEERAARH